MLIKNLIEFGLSEKEAKAYIALLELEVAPVQEVAKRAGLNRSSTYVVLDSLKEKGLLSISDKMGVRQYIATPPEILTHMAETMAERQEKVKKNINNLVPELKALFKGTKTKPVVRVYEGKNGVIAAMEDILNSGEKLMRVAASVGRLMPILPPTYFAEYFKKRFTLGIKMHSIHPYDEVYKQLVSISPKNFDEPIGIPKEKYKFSSDIAIYSNKIQYISGDANTTVIIESAEMSDTMKSVFDLAWEEAKRLSKETRKEEK